MPLFNTYPARVTLHRNLPAPAEFEPTIPVYVTQNRARVGSHEVRDWYPTVSVKQTGALKPVHMNTCLYISVGRFWRPEEISGDTDYKTAHACFVPPAAHTYQRCMCAVQCVSLGVMHPGVNIHLFDVINLFLGSGSSES